MKILVVDNSKSILFLMNDMLSKYGHQVKTALDGITALEILETFKPDVIFIDWVMPAMSGDKLCQIIRQNPDMDNVFIIIISGMIQGQEFDYKAIGADACLAKGPPQQMEENITSLLAFVGREDDLGMTSKVLGLERLFPRQATTELLALKNHLEALLNTLNEGIVEMTGDNKIIYANPAAIEVLQIEEKRLLSATFPHLFGEENSQLIEDLIDKLDGGPQQLGDDEPFFHNGRYLKITFKKVPDQELPLIIAVIRDETEFQSCREALRLEKLRYNK